MKLINFELSKPAFAIELLALGFVWDLHNVGTFLGLELNAAENTAVMRWNVSGHPSAKYSGCDLIFRNLRSVVISQRDAELPLSEDDCISGISKVVPNDAVEARYRARNEWGAGEPFRLWFQFQSQRTIEIDSETVELVGVTKAR